MTAVIQRSFASGEIAPALYARADQTRFQTGCRTLRNMYVMRHGGATSRPGLIYKAQIDTNVTQPRLIPFHYTDARTYALVMGKVASSLVLHAYKQGALSYGTPLTITGITKANPAVVTSNSHGLTLNDSVKIAAVGGMTQVNGNTYYIGTTTANTFELYKLDGTALDSTGFGAYTAGGTATPTSMHVFTYAPTFTTDSVKVIQYNQRADKITFCASTLRTPVVTNVSDSSWTFADISYSAVQGPPTVLTGGAGGGPPYYEQWAVTAVSSVTGEESIISNVLQSGTAVTTAAPQTISWTAPSGTAPSYYNVYKWRGAWGFYGVAESTSFIDNGAGTIDFSNPPPELLLFGHPDVSSFYPAVIGSFNQRGVFSGNPAHFGRVWASRPSTPSNMTSKSPSLADDPIDFTLTGKSVVNVRHVVDAGKPVILTSTSDFALEGNQGVITPTEINPNQQAGKGAAQYPQPLVIDGSAIYVSARGSKVRDLFYHVEEDGYRGNEISLFAAHLFEGKTVVDWAYQEHPHQLLWVVLDDGTALSLTYVKEQQIFGWARHDTDGDFKSVCCIPEGTEDAVYFLVERTINGTAKTYLERLADRFVTEETIEGYVGVDAALQYDGRVASLYAAGTIGGMYTMTLSGGTAWDNTETLTLTASSSYFVVGDVGKGIFLTGTDGTLVRFTIGAYTSGTVVTGTIDVTAPVSMRSVAIAEWSKAINTVTGLDHLEAKAVSVFADSSVIANPNNADLTAITVASGSITLPDNYARITVGLPYICDLETLDIDSAGGETLVDKNKLITQVALHIEKSRGIYTGPRPPSDDDTDPLENLYLMRHDTPDTLKTEVFKQNLAAQWNSNGRVFIRQIDPLPMTILAATPCGLMPFKKGAG